MSVAVRQFVVAGPMAPHLTAKELDIVAQAVGKRKNAGEVHRVIVARRLKEGVPPPQIWAIRRACQGATHRRGRPEARGRKKELSYSQVKRLNDTRIRLMYVSGRRSLSA